MSASIECLQQLLGGQLSAFAHKLATEFPDNPDILARAQELAAGMVKDIDVVNYKPKRKTRGPRKPQKAIDPAERCCARVWGDGSGSHRCKKRQADGDFCKLHAKKAAICCKPCATIENGKKRHGLFMGRFDDWQDGEEGVLPFKDTNGFLRIEWTSESMRARVSADLKSGALKRPTVGLGSVGGGSKKKKKTPKTVVPSAAEVAAKELADAVSSSAVTSAVSSTESSLVSAVTTAETKLNEPVQTTPDQQAASADSQVFDADTEDDEPEQNTSDSGNLLAEIDAATVSSNESKQAEEEQEVEVEEREFGGKTYHVDSNSGTIYWLNDDSDERYGTEIGTWKEDGPSINLEHVDWL